MMQHNTFIGVPCKHNKTNETIRKVLINAVGFGGNGECFTVALVSFFSFKSSCFQTLSKVITEFLSLF
jgi:hypothetical protein